LNGTKFGLSFAKGQRQLQGFEIVDPEIGDIYVFTAIDQKTKLLALFAVGKRTHETARALVADLNRRMIRAPVERGADRPQLSTDGWASYVPTIRAQFGKTVRHRLTFRIN
jgi:IS1 family transposase